MDSKNIELKNCFKVLKDRGYFYQSTGEVEIEKLLTEKPTTIYLGIDPTADSLHIGHCFPLFMLRPLQKAGHKIIILIGGATAMIGDPSGQTDMRKLVTSEFINSNLAKIKAIISKFLNAEGENPFVIVNNADWFKGFEYISFMREIGVHFNVSKMLATDAYANRMAEGGLTFFEMGYMLMQAYDFVHLNKEYGCKLQVGGSDQWANMLAGCELGRKLNFLQGKQTDDFQAFTVPLLTNSEGKKMGKTVKGAVWVDENKTTPFEFYQYFYNVNDADVEKLFKSTTEVSLERIAEIMKGDILEAKRTYAFEITRVVHGNQKAIEAQKTADELFTTGNADNAPEFMLEKASLPIDIISLCALTGLTASKGEARKLIEQNGISLNGEKLESTLQIISEKDLDAEGNLMLKKGKKTFLKVVVK